MVESSGQVQKVFYWLQNKNVFDLLAGYAISIFLNNSSATEQEINQEVLVR